MARESDKKGLRPGAGNRPGLITAESWEKLRQLLEWADLVPDPDHFEIVEIAGRRQFRPKRKEPESAAAVAGGEGSASGSFCGTFEEGGATFINGGAMLCGDKNFYVEPFEVDTGGDGEWLVQILLGDIEFATDDDEEIFLPGGVESSDDTPSWDLKSYSSGTDYDDNTNPSDPSDTGSIVIPIGYLKVEDGVVTFRAESCGHIGVGQCAGILFHTR